MDESLRSKVTDFIRLTSLSARPDMPWSRTTSYQRAVHSVTKETMKLTTLKAVMQPEMDI